MSIILEPPIFWTAVSISFISICGGVYYFYKGMLDRKKQENLDTLVFIDKNNRWSKVYADLSNCSKYVYDKRTYFLNEDCAIRNNKGKTMYIFSINNPNPLKIDYKNPEWLSADSLTATINNELISKMINPSSVSDSFILFGVIASIVGALASIMIALKIFGVFK